MTTTNHYISITDPSNPSFMLGSGGGGGAQNINDGTSSTAADLVEVRWVANTTIAQTVTRKQLLMALKTIMKFVIRGGYGTSGSPDGNIPT